MNTETWTLNSPVASFTFDGRPPYWRLIVPAWFLLWIGVTIGVAYLYAVVFPRVVGFETAVLFGIALIIISGGVGE